MLGPSRPLPRVGARGRVTHFGGELEAVTVLAVADGGRRVTVRGEGAQELEFRLNPATARFELAGARHGPRLELLGQDAAQDAGRDLGQEAGRDLGRGAALREP